MSRPGIGRARLAVSVVFAVHGAVYGTFATRIPWIADQVHVRPGGLGLALLAPALGAVVTMPLTARLVHRYDGRTVVRLLLLVCCAAGALPPLAPNLPALFAILLGYGAASGMADVAMNSQGVLVEERYGRSIMSSLHGMWSIGGLVASMAGALAAHARVDARIHLAVAGGILMIVGWVASSALPVTPRPTAGPHPSPVEPHSLPAEPGPLFALPSRAVLLIGLVGFCAVFGEGAAGDWCAVYLRDVTSADSGIAASAFTGFALTMAAGRLVGDRVVRRVGPVNCVRLSGLIAAAGGLLVLLARSPVPAIAGFALMGVGIAVVVPLAFAAAGRTAANSAQAIAAVATIAYGAGMVAPAAIGGIAHLFSLRVAFAVVAGLCATISLGAVALRTRRAPVQDPESEYVSTG